MKKIINIEIDKGTDLSVDFTIKDAAGNVVDFSDCDFLGYIRESGISNNHVYELSCSAPTPSNGVLNIAMTHDATTQLPPGRYFYDVVMIKDSVYTKILSGIAIVTPSSNIYDGATGVYVNSISPTQGATSFLIFH
jgi:hypothetical protein